MIYTEAFYCIRIMGFMGLLFARHVAGQRKQEICIEFWWGKIIGNFHLEDDE
jgi:hypothetical protein